MPSSNHSAGMEAAIEAGWVRDLDDVAAFCVGRLRTSGRVALENSATVNPALGAIAEADHSIFRVEGGVGFKDSGKVLVHALPIVGVNKRQPSVAGAEEVWARAEDLIEHFGRGPFHGREVESVGANTRNPLRLL